MMGLALTVLEINCLDVLDLDDLINLTAALDGSKSDRYFGARLLQHLYIKRHSL